MDLYSPIYVTRPQVQPSIAASVTPQRYSPGTATAAVPLARAYDAPTAEMEDSFSGYGYLAESQSAVDEAPINLGQGVQAAADVRSASVYRIAHPLTVPRREAALIPIIADSIPAQRISIYDQTVLSDRPLLGVRITNDAGVQLPAGPATLFDGSTYGGDTQIPSMVEDEERLISYAVDLSTNVIVRSDQRPQSITRLVIVDGYLHISNRYERTTEYVIDRLDPEQMHYLIVHPKRSQWEIVGDVQPATETQDRYRFEVDVEGSSTRTLAVEEEYIQENVVAVQNLNDSQIAIYLSQSVIDDETAAILGRVRELRSALADRRAERQQIANQISAIHQEQDRIRQNLDVVETGSTLYQRYIDTLTEQEDRLEQLNDQLSAAAAAEQAAQRALSDYLASL
jgi:outer membrane murein-binding lipoprotein Lpp